MRELINDRFHISQDIVNDAVRAGARDIDTSPGVIDLLDIEFMSSTGHKEGAVICPDEEELFGRDQGCAFVTFNVSASRNYFYSFISDIFYNLSLVSYLLSINCAVWYDFIFFILLLLLWASLWGRTLSLPPFELNYFAADKLGYFKACTYE